jgi:hypothetical protein
MLRGKVSKWSITSTLDISPDSALYPISGVLRDHHQSKPESVSKVIPLVRCVPTIITSSLFIRLEHTSNNWKVRKLTTSLILHIVWDDKASVVKKAVFRGGSSLSAQTYSSLANVQKFITLRTVIVSGRVNNRWKEEKVFYNVCIGLLVRFQACQHQNWIF